MPRVSRFEKQMHENEAGVSKMRREMSQVRLPFQGR